MYINVVHHNTKLVRSICAHAQIITALDALYSQPIASQVDVVNIQRARAGWSRLLRSAIINAHHNAQAGWRLGQATYTHAGIW